MDLLKDLVGRQVQVYSVRGETEVADTGILESYNDAWVCLRRDNAMLYFSIFRIRLIKPL